MINKDVQLDHLPLQLHGRTPAAVMRYCVEPTSSDPELSDSIFADLSSGCPISNLIHMAMFAVLLFAPCSDQRSLRSLCCLTFKFLGALTR